MQYIAKTLTRKSNFAYHLFRHRPKSNFSSSIKIPQRIGLLGYGAIGKAFTEMLFKAYPNLDAKLVAMDKEPLPQKDSRFKYIQQKITRDNVQNILKYLELQPGDFLVDLSCNIPCTSVWPICKANNIRYLNTALEMWEDNQTFSSYPKNESQAYKSSISNIRDALRTSKDWDGNKGPTALFEMGMNPGIISHCVNRGLEDAARHYLKDDSAHDIDKFQLERFLKEKNHSKIAQTLGVHTIHCAETDLQTLDKPPADIKKPGYFYNTWGIDAFLSEGLLPVQAARGSHEDTEIKDFFTVRNQTFFMSQKPSCLMWAKSWVPNQDIVGSLIPHGESLSIREYLYDRETGYAPSQYYVYDFNKYAKQFMLSLGQRPDVNEVKPTKAIILHPKDFPTLSGLDIVGSLLLMKNNRGWWTGTVMDDIDCRVLFNHQYGPTVMQVAAGAWAGFLWACANPNKGSRFPEKLDTDFIIEKALPYLGRWFSLPVDLNKTHLKDCYKFQSFFTQPKPIPE